MTFTGYIYKITGACGLIYIGSTTDKITRKSKHKTDKNNSSSSRLLLKPLQFEIIDTREYTLVKTLHLMEQYYLDNINNINQRRAYTNKKKYKINYRSINSEKIKYQQRVWRGHNKEKVNKNNRNYYNKNKVQINQKHLVVVKCECGCLITKVHKSRHIKTKKHLKLMNLL